MALRSLRLALFLMIRVIIADDFPLVRRSIRALLSTARDIKVIGEAANGQEAVEVTQRLAPDVVVMDISMPRLDGFQATAQIHALGLSARVLAVSMYTDASVVENMLDKGARGFVSKANLGDQLLPAIRAVHQDAIYLSPAIASMLDEEE